MRLFSTPWYSNNFSEKILIFAAPVFPHLIYLIESNSNNAVLSMLSASRANAIFFRYAKYYNRKSCNIFNKDRLN